MPRYSGKDLVVMVENSSASEVAFTFVKAATINFDYEENQMTGDDVKSAAAGQLMAEVIIDYEFDTTATSGNQAVLSGIIADNTNPRFVRVQPIGSTTGDPEFAMDALLTKFGPTGVDREGSIVGQAVFKNHHAASADPAWGTV